MRDLRRLEYLCWTLMDITVATAFAAVFNVFVPFLLTQADILRIQVNIFFFLNTTTMWGMREDQ